MQRRWDILDMQQSNTDESFMSLLHVVVVDEAFIWRFLIIYPIPLSIIAISAKWLVLNQISKIKETHYFRSLRKNEQLACCVDLYVNETKVRKGNQSKQKHTWNSKKTKKITKHWALGLYTTICQEVILNVHAIIVFLSSPVLSILISLLHRYYTISKSLWKGFSNRRERTRLNESLKQWNFTTGDVWFCKLLVTLLLRLLMNNF